MFKQTAWTALMLGLCEISHATVIQYFWANTYNNPAQLNATKNMNITFGGLGVQVDGKFTGIGAGGEAGTATSSETAFLPYLTFSKRLNKKWVAGINISQPYFGNSSYPSDSVVAFDTTVTKIFDLDIAPQLSYQVNDKLALGFGLNFNNMHRAEIDFMTSTGEAINTASDWSYGWNVGLFYVINATNFLGLTYYSGLNPVLTGVSSNQQQLRTDFSLTGFNLPPTLIATYIHMVTSDWTLVAKTSFSQWNRTQTAYLNNVAGVGTLAFPVKYRNTWTVELDTKYQLNKKYALIGGLFFDQGGARTTSGRTIPFPAGDFKAAFAGASAQLTKNSTLQLVVGGGRLGVAINRPLDQLPTVGNLRINGYIADLRFIYNLDEEKSKDK